MVRHWLLVSGPACVRTLLLINQKLRKSVSVLSSPGALDLSQASSYLQ